MLSMVGMILSLAGDPQPVAVQPSGPHPVTPRPEAPRSPGTVAAPRIPPPMLDRSRTGPVDPEQLARDEQARSLGLRRIATGYLYKGSVDERFDAIVHHDGTVEFDVDPNVVVRLDGLCLAAICVRTKKDRREPKRMKGRSLAASAAALLIESALTSAGSSGAPYGQPVGGPSPLTPNHEDPPPFPLAGIQGRYGYLPAPVAAMSGFMDRTFELRLQMARAAAHERVELELRRLPTTLSQLWREPSLTSAERRAKILELWADLEDEAVPHRDDVLAAAMSTDLQVRRREAATRARQTMLKFVRRIVPEGSPEAFTEAELDAFHRRSDVRTRFEPYRPEPAAASAPPRPDGAAAR